MRESVPEESMTQSDLSAKPYSGVDIPANLILNKY